MDRGDLYSNQEDEIDLKDIFKVLWVRKAFLIVFVTLMSALAFMLIQKLPNVYRSTVMIMLKPSAKSTDAIQSLLTGSITAADNTETELQLIKSKNILSKVAEKLELHKHPAFKRGSYQQSESSAVVPADSDAVMKILLSNLRVNQLPDTDIIAISYESHYPELSASVANNIGETFIVYKETLTANKHKQGAKFLATKLEEVKAGLELAELKIVEYQSAHQFIDIKSAASLATTKLTQLHAKRDALLASIDQLNISKSHILQHSDEPETLLFLPIFADSRSIVAHKDSLKRLRQKFAETKLRYGPKHPKYMAAQELLNTSLKGLNKLVDEQVGNVNKQLDIQQQQVKFFDQEIAKLTLRLNQLGIIEFDYEKLKKEFDANLALYESLVKKQTESELMQDLTDASNSILIESAEVAKTPVKPNRKTLFILSFIASLLVGCIIVLLDFVMGNKIIKFKKVAAKFDTRIIGAIPKVAKASKGVITKIDEKKHIKFLEAVRTIRTSILLDKERAKHQVIAITSISPNDGKSTLAFQLSKCFSEVGTTLLIDADLRYPSIAKALKEETERPGLTNLIVHSHSLKDAVIKSEDKKFDIITSGHIPKNPLAFLQHKRFGGLLSGLKKNYQRILLECPPIMSVSDAFVVSKYVDSVYLIVDSQKANVDELAGVLEELKQAEVKVGGVILNKVKEKRGYGSYSYHGYYGRASKR